MIAILFILAVMIGSQYFFNFIFGTEQDYAWHSKVGYLFMMILLLFFAIQLFLACLALQKRFEKLRKNLESFIPRNQVQIVASTEKTVLPEIGRIYHTLCDGIETINDTFTFPFILILANVLVSHSIIKLRNLNSLTQSVSAFLCVFCLCVRRRDFASFECWVEQGLLQRNFLHFSFPNQSYDC